MSTDDKSREPMNACGMINPTLTLSGPCADCGGSGRIPVEGFQCDECGHLISISALDEEAFGDATVMQEEHEPTDLMPCGHEWGLYYPFRMCQPCNGIGKREEAVSLPDLFDLLENERDRRAFVRQEQQWLAAGGHKA